MAPAFGFFARLLHVGFFAGVLHQVAFVASAPMGLRPAAVEIVKEHPRHQGSTGFGGSEGVGRPWRLFSGDYEVTSLRE